MKLLIGIIVLVIIGIAGGWLWVGLNDPDMSGDEMISEKLPEIFKKKLSQEKRIYAQAVDLVNENFQFSVEVPNAWTVQAVPETEALAFFSGEAANLDEAQIYMRSFRADTFLTLQTVNILQQREFEINGRPAIEYEIEKKSGVPNFSGQPAWRNRRHIVTDIRVADESPSVFYVIAKQPDLDEKIYQRFLKSLNVTFNQRNLVPPTAEFLERIRLKPFGILIDPATSPVQPERFSGYHTAVDVEFTDVMSDVPVRAITSGRVVRSGVVNGYGGMVAIVHEMEGQEVIGIYGHLRPSNLIAVGEQVSTGEPIGVLGTGESAETDGERKHLHFGLVKGSEVDVRGYVQSEEELLKWIDPASLF